MTKLINCSKKRSLVGKGGKISYKRPHFLFTCLFVWSWYSNKVVKKRISVYEPEDLWK